MHTTCKNILGFLKIDFTLTFKNSLLLSIAYLFLIPVIRGISNLDHIHSALVLGQSVALIGPIILIPITKQELEPGVKEIIYTKAWPYMKSVGIRFSCSILIIAITITAFATIMQYKHCTFPLGRYISITILYATLLGLPGLILSEVGNNVIIGYLSSFGYWTLCQLEIINERSIFYMFPIINGTVETQKLGALILIITFLLVVYLLLIKHSTSNV